MKEVRLFPTSIVLCSFITAIGCAHPAAVRIPGELEDVWGEYLELEPHKAMMIAGSPDRKHWVAGVVGGFETAAEAMAAARSECADRRSKHRIQAQCVPFAEGEKLVWRGY